ncbi:hypothetical protein P9112_011538 [Eukaryota sp. TZLM1-RC]
MYGQQLPNTTQSNDVVWEGRPNVCFLSDYTSCRYKLTKNWLYVSRRWPYSKRHQRSIKVSDINCVEIQPVMCCTTADVVVCYQSHTYVLHSLDNAGEVAQLLEELSSVARVTLC